MWIRVRASELTCISATLGSPHTRSLQGWSGLRLEANIVSCRRKDLSLYLTNHCAIEKYLENRHFYRWKVPVHYSYFQEDILGKIYTMGYKNKIWHLQRHHKAQGSRTLTDYIPEECYICAITSYLMECTPPFQITSEQESPSSPFPCAGPAPKS